MKNMEYTLALINTCPFEYFVLYKRAFMLSLSEDNQSNVIEAFNSTSRYLDDLLNIDNNLFDSMGNRIYPSEPQ